MFIEIHTIQNFAPSNLNRDDTGSPKECEFGGHRRARRHVGLGLVGGGLDRGRHGRSHDAEPRHSVPGTARVTGLEIEEPLEERRGAGAVWLALAAIHDDHARRSGA